jgi:hypothetical protein
MTRRIQTMTRTSKRAFRPGLDDLEGRNLLSMFSPGGGGPSAPAVTTHLARPMSVEAHGGLVGMTHQGSSGHALQASAASIRPGTYSLRDKATNLYLDSNTDGHVYTLPHNTGKFQKWEFRPSGDGFSFNIVDDATGLSLDSNFDGNVYTLPHNTGNFQRWVLWPDGGGYYTIYDYETGNNLDSNAAGQVYTHIQNTGPYQRWLLTATTP